MPAPAHPSAGHSSDGQAFAVTRWSVVLAARGDEPVARAALAQLCETYWYPLYAFVRRQRYEAPDAQDLTQAFFALLLEKGWLDDVAPSKGRFRAFLLASMKHFLSNERDRAAAQKRGGGRLILSLDAASAESRYAAEPIDGTTPEKIFERRWAMTLLDQALTRLRKEFARTGKAALFDALKPILAGQAAPYAQIGANLGMSEGAVKVAAHRLRNRYRELILQEVAQTVGTSDDIEAEMRDLMSALQA